MSIKHEIREILLDLEGAYAANDKQIIMRCRFCGDSKKDHNKKRLGFKLDVNNTQEPIMFQCFNCGISGVLTPSILRELGADSDLKISSGLTKFNNQTSHESKLFTTKQNKLNFKVPLFPKSKSNDLKKGYIEKRLGIQLSYEDLQRFKVVLNLGDFLSFNKIETITKNRDACKNIHDYYVGFLTAMNEFINFRNVTNITTLKRYENYAILNNIDNTRKFYVIPTDIDVMTNENIEIVIAEGVFDILGLYYHVYNCNSKNKLFVAICGCGYVNVIKHILRLGIVGDNVIISLYSDKDKDMRFYTKQLNMKQFKRWVGGIDVYYNELSKDYGVTKDEISLLKYKMV